MRKRVQNIKIDLHVKDFEFEFECLIRNSIKTLIQLILEL